MYTQLHTINNANIFKARDLFGSQRSSQIYIYSLLHRDRLQWSRGSVLAVSTQVRGFKPGRSRRIFRAKKSSARLPSEGK